MSSDKTEDERKADGSQSENTGGRNAEDEDAGDDAVADDAAEGTRPIRLRSTLYGIYDGIADGAPDWSVEDEMVGDRAVDNFILLKQKHAQGTIMTTRGLEY